ncbi:MAG TPA: hypothetical protein VHO03_16640 [Ignavibacteriales bacterium]|nr:hypothetical protein [Ignavibacteriales bacterium]
MSVKGIRGMSEDEDFFLLEGMNRSLEKKVKKPRRKKEPKQGLTHSNLVELSRIWLGRQGNSVIITELNAATYYGETPDAIGWQYGHSTLIECKANLADFRADRRKPFRVYPEKGLGDFRYYFTLKGLLKVGDIPDKWGLIETDGVKSRIVKKAEYQDSNKESEALLLLSAIKRMGPNVTEGIQVKFYKLANKRSATISLEEVEEEISDFKGIL